MAHHIIEGMDEAVAALQQIAEGLGRVKLTITMIAHDRTNVSADQPVHDESVIVTDTATGNVLYAIPYTGSPVEIEIARDKSFTVTGTQVNAASTTFYAPSVYTGIAQSDTSITVTYQMLSAANSLLAIQDAIAANPGVEILPVGTEVTIPYTATNGTEYDMILVLVHYGYAVKEEDAQTGRLTWGAYFMCKYATLESVVFDAPEVEEATETTAASGIVYYGLSGTTYSILSLEQGDEIPYGDYDHVYKNEIRDTSFNILKNGYNRWSHSAYRQWLNSEALAGAWWSAQHIGDTAPSSLASYNGFLHGLRSQDKQAIQTIKINTALNTVTDSALGTLETTFDKIWLPSVKEMYGVEQLAGEGDTWVKYWADFIGLTSVSNDSNTLRRFFPMESHSGSAQSVRLRSAYRGNSGIVWNVNTAGQITSSTASYAFRSAPACFIG